MSLERFKVLFIDILKLFHVCLKLHQNYVLILCYVDVWKTLENLKGGNSSIVEAVCHVKAV